MTSVPLLNISLLDTYNPTVLSILDVSEYPIGYIVQNPYVEITPPGFSKVTSIFTPKSINIFNAPTLGLAPSGTLSPLPDGLYKIRYSIQPNHINLIDRDYYKIDQLKEAYDRGFLKLGLTICNSNAEEKMRLLLDEAELYIQGAVAAANSCNVKLAQELYKKAQKILEKLNCYASL